MKILLVSDTHGDNEILQYLRSVYPDLDYYLHAGDSQSDIYSIYPFESVEGNCDYCPFDELFRVQTPMGYLLMKHKLTFTEEQIKDNKFFIFGHTHQNHIFIDGDKVFINPGSTSRPRDGTNGTYAILEIKEKTATIIIYDIETKNVLIKKEIR